MANDRTVTRKEIAIKFLELVVAGQFDEAYRKYVDIQGKHHNPFFAAGFPALKQAMMENHAQFPDKKLIVRNVLGDGDLVAVHSHLVLQPGTAEMITVHLFRFQGNAIVEFWDCGQSLPRDSPNVDGAF